MFVQPQALSSVYGIFKILKLGLFIKLLFICLFYITY